MYSIAFLWVGENTDIPRRLVESIRLVMGDSIDVIQLTDRKTPKVPGVSRVQRSNLSSFIMVARLQAYSQVKTSEESIFFCDADSLFISPLELNFQDTNILLSKRNIDGLINDRYPEFYPEFTGKRLAEVMPFLFGAIATRGDQSDFFDSLLNICTKLPLRFHRWYGDQYALASALATGSVNYGLLTLEKHLAITKTELSSKQISLARDFGVQMITFKGPSSKAYMEATLVQLRELLGRNL